MPCLSFSALSGISQVVHAFTLRHPQVDVQADRAEVLRRLKSAHEAVVHSLGFAAADVAYGEQIHGAEVAVVAHGTPMPVPGVDGLITATPGLMLGMYVADCCAVYTVDEETGALGLAHAGRKGAELGVTRNMIRLMKEKFGVNPASLVVQLSPCIRPPVFEIDFAALIKDQALEQGVPAERIFDEGISTASDLTRFYSYRMEKGKTGRMLALLGRVKG